MVQLTKEVRKQIQEGKLSPQLKTEEDGDAAMIGMIQRGEIYFTTDQLGMLMQMCNSVWAGGGVKGRDGAIELMELQDIVMEEFNRRQEEKKKSLRK